MSQRVCFTEVNGVLYPEVFSSLPDMDEAIALAKEMVEEGLISPADDYDVWSVWYEVGEGESGMDTFFSNDTLIRWYEDFDMHVAEAGYTAERINIQALCVRDNEVYEEDEDE